MTASWTILSLLRETARYFAHKGIDSARLDAELLLAYCLGRSRVALYADYACPVTPEELNRYRELVRRRGRREPVAYILGEREFWSLSLHVTSAVLVPRPETELLVEQCLRILPARDGLRILEIGTGTAAIVIALVCERPDLRVVATDLSPSALACARQNLARHDPGGRITLLAADGVAAVRTQPVFDLIVSNPPYIAAAEFVGLAPEVSSHEPRMALDGGTDGLAWYRRWIPQLPCCLASGGRIVLEIGHGQATAVAALLVAAGLQPEPCVHDYAGQERVLVACLL